MTKWTKIQNALFAKFVKNKIHGNTCEYHNMFHVKTMYDYLEATNEPYDEALDWAVLFHDCVYDNQPRKEARSAEFFLKYSNIHDGCDLRTAEKYRVYDLIMCTSDHVVKPELKGSSAIVRADLHGLTNRVRAFYNFNLIMEESMKLYQIDEVEFAKNSVAFMNGLYDRVDTNMRLDPNHKDFYIKVLQGIRQTITHSKAIVGDI